MFDRRIVQGVVASIAIMLCASATLFTFPSVDGTDAIDEVLYEILTNDPKLTLFTMVAIILVVLIVILVILFRKGEKQEHAPQHVQNCGTSGMPPMPITTIGEYCLLDNCIRLSSGKEIPYEQIDDVKLSKDYEPMVLLTFGADFPLYAVMGN